MSKNMKFHLKGGPFKPWLFKEFMIQKGLFISRENLLPKG